MSWVGSVRSPPPVSVRVVCPASSRTPVTSAVVARASSSRFIQSLPVSQTGLTVPTVSQNGPALPSFALFPHQERNRTCVKMSPLLLLLQLNFRPSLDFTFMKSDLEVWTNRRSFSFWFSSNVCGNVTSVHLFYQANTLDDFHNFYIMDTQIQPEYFLNFLWFFFS